VLFARILAVASGSTLLAGALGSACGGKLEGASASSDPSQPRAMCGPGRLPRFPSGLKASPPQDFVGVRFETAYLYGTFAKADGGSSDTDSANENFTSNASNTYGTPCATASDVPSCLRALEALRVLPKGRAACEAAYPHVTHPGGAHPGCSVSYLVFTRGDEVGFAIEDAEVRALVGPVDTVQEAEWVLEHAYDPTCGGDKGQTFTVREIDGGYEFSFVNNCEASSVVRTVFVARDGSLVERPRVHAPVGTEFSCAVAGRRPEGFVPSPAAEAESPSAAYFASMAELEAAAVLAFRRLGRDLAGLGAPSALRARVRQAVRDEIRHTRAARSLSASRRDARKAVAAAPWVDRGARALAIENAREGCVRETYGALLAWHQAAHAEDPRVRAVMAAIAEEETAHAALSFDVARWLDGLLGSADRDAVLRERQLAQMELAQELAAPVEDRLARSIGLPDATRARLLLEELEGIDPA
jgi:hypothetical protein